MRNITYFLLKNKEKIADGIWISVLIILTILYVFCNEDLMSTIFSWINYYKIYDIILTMLNACLEILSLIINKTKL